MVDFVLSSRLSALFVSVAHSGKRKLELLRMRQLKCLAKTRGMASQVWILAYVN